MESRYSEFIKSNYLPILTQIRVAIEENGKDFTHQQFAEIFNVSRKTFEQFYSGNLIRFDLLIELGSMYEFEFNFNIYEK